MANATDFDLKRETQLPKFRIFDLLLGIALLALHFANYRMLSLGTDAEIAGLLHLTPTLLAAWILFRSRISIPHATLLHYLLSLGWAFANTFCYELAINFRESMANETRRTMPLWSAVDTMIDMTMWSVAFSATFALVCYAAVSSPRPSTLPNN
ncbi:similar to helicase/primase complex protein [Rhodopirellula baltica SH 1]|uniref:Similar to helicase/primase complex protein n=1 Tax=Rhodopirellula baltica (strain DSM 10527 / NCIMB 13988 / SH1) TaxID=243090 RepID=Q7UUT6_RHOBA|nr:similar to helicase/primase complex protein [Rhodopirellula baltica SH 1]